MDFNLSFNISESNDCRSATLCDTTCLINHYDKFTCCDGYGVEGNISREDIAYTRFHWKFPNGNEFLNVDMNWVPGTRAKGIFDIPSGTNGVIVVDIDSLVIGQTVFITDIATTRATLIQSINSIASQTGWQAYEDPNQSDRIIVESINLGNEYNGRFYPTFSGVAQSFNFYPVSHQEREDGIVSLAAGLGYSVVGGETVLRFSPKYPEIIPDFSTPKSVFENSQRKLYVLNTKKTEIKLSEKEDTPLEKINISEIYRVVISRK